METNLAQTSLAKLLVCGEDQNIERPVPLYLTEYLEANVKNWQDYHLYTDIPKHFLAEGVKIYAADSTPYMIYTWPEAENGLRIQCISKKNGPLGDLDSEAIVSLDIKIKKGDRGIPYFTAQKAYVYNNYYLIENYLLNGETRDRKIQTSIYDRNEISGNVQELVGGNYSRPNALHYFTCYAEKQEEDQEEILPKITEIYHDGGQRPINNISSEMFSQEKVYSSYNALVLEKVKQAYKFVATNGPDIAERREFKGKIPPFELEEQEQKPEYLGVGYH